MKKNEHLHLNRCTFFPATPPQKTFQHLHFNVSEHLGGALSPGSAFQLVEWALPVSKHDDSEGKSHVSRMESSILREGERDETGEGGGGLSGHSTCTSRWAAGADRAAERQDMAWHSWNLWFDMSSVWESVRRAGGKGLEGTAASPQRLALWVFITGRSDRGGGGQLPICARNPRGSTGKVSLLLVHVGRGKPAHPTIELSLPPAIRHLGVDLDNVSLQQRELPCFSGAEVVACHCNAHHSGREDTANLGDGPGHVSIGQFPVRNLQSGVKTAEAFL